MSIVLQGSTSGSCTLQEQAVAGNTVLTLPTTSGTILTTASSITQNSGPAFSAWQSVAQTLSSNTYTKIQLQSEEFDTANCFNTTTFRFTPNVAGYYQISGAFQVSSLFCGGTITIYKNGASFKQGFSNNTASEGNIWALSALIYFNGTTDYVELYGSIVTGQTLVASDAGTYFQGVLVRAA